MANTSGERVVLITGAGGGLGRATIRTFLDNGWQVVASDVSEAALAEHAEDVRVTRTTLDVTDSASARAAAERVTDRHGRLDLLINNAGIMGYFPVVETDPEIIDRHFQINSLSALRVTHAFLDLLTRSKGRVINISSESWRLRSPFLIYPATKLALEGISDVMRRELTHLSVQVTTIRPGAIDTSLFRAIEDIQNPIADSRLAGVFTRMADLLTRHPPSRISQPEDVAALIYRASTDKTMRPHYEMNNMLSLKLASMLPARWLDAIIYRLLASGESSGANRS